MIVSPEGQFITARSHPKLVLIQPRFEGTNMILSAPKMEDITINVASISKLPVSKSYVWQQEVSSIDCGDEIAIWLSRYICNEDMGVRLSYYPDSKPSRPVRGRNLNFKQLTDADSVTNNTYV